MANPHFRVQIISRGDGKNVVNAVAYRSQSRLEQETAGAASSVVAAAAYRAGDTLEDTTEDGRRVFDYSRKQGIVHSEILTPERAPEWARDRQQLWSTVEATERRKDAQLARDFIISLPRELDGEPEAQTSLALRFAQKYLVSRGMVADVNIHDVAARDGGRNVHAHITVTMRRIDADGFDGKKAREWNSRGLLQQWRDGWERMVNEELEARGIEERLSLKSYKARGIEREPTKPLGVEANALEKRGVSTKRGDENRRIKERNAERELQGLYKERQAAEPGVPDQQRRQQADSRIEELRRGGDTEGEASGEKETRRRGRAVPPPAGPGTREERAAWYASFSLKLGAATDAARDALHRFKRKDVEAATRRESEEQPMSDDRRKSFADSIRSTMGKIAEAGKSALNRGKEAAPQGQERTGTAAGAQPQAAAPQEASASTTESSTRDSIADKLQGAQQDIASIRAQAQASGVRQTDSSYNAPVADARQPEQTQRAQGLSRGGEADTRGLPASASSGAAPRLDTAAPADRSSLDPSTSAAQSNARASVADKLGAAQNEAINAASTILQQNGSTVEGGAGTQGPPQQEQRQSGATQGQGTAQAGASAQQGASAGQGTTQQAGSGQQGASVAQERAAAMAEHTRGQDKGIAQQKEQAQQKDMER